MPSPALPARSSLLVRAATIPAVLIGTTGVFLTGCSNAPRIDSDVAAADAPTAESRAVLTVQLEADDAQDAATAPVSFERRWFGSPLGDDAYAAGDDRDVFVRFLTPVTADLPDVEDRAAWITFPGEQFGVTDTAASSVQVFTLERPAVTLTLARGVDAANASGVARITFAPFFQETLFDLDHETQADDALWFALLGNSVDDTAAFAAYTADFDIAEAIALSERGVNPNDLTALQDQGQVFDFAELIELSDAGVAVTDAVRYGAQGVPTDVASLVAHQQRLDDEAALAAAQAEFEADAAEVETAEAETEIVESDIATAEAPVETEAEVATESVPAETEVAFADEFPADFTTDADATAFDTPSTDAFADAQIDADRDESVEATVVIDEAPELVVEVVAAPVSEPVPAVPAAFADQVAALGFTDARQVEALFTAGVTADEVLWFRNAGFELTAEQQVEAHELGLDPVAARMLIDAGYTVSFADLKTLHAANADPAYAVALVDERFAMLSADQIARLWQNRVSLRDIRAAREARLQQPIRAYD